MLEPIKYDYKEFTLANGETNYDVKENVLGLFLYVAVAKNVQMKTNKNITFKFNRTSLEAVDFGIGDSPAQISDGFMDITNIYLTNASGVDATIQIWLT